MPNPFLMLFIYYLFKEQLPCRIFLSSRTKPHTVQHVNVSLYQWSVFNTFSWFKSCFETLNASKSPITELITKMIVQVTCLTFMFEKMHSVNSTNMQYDLLMKT